MVKLPVWRFLCSCSVLSSAFPHCVGWSHTSSLYALFYNMRFAPLRIFIAAVFSFKINRSIPIFVLPKLDDIISVKTNLGSSNDSNIVIFSAIQGNDSSFLTAKLDHTAFQHHVKVMKVRTICTSIKCCIKFELHSHCRVLRFGPSESLFWLITCHTLFSLHSFIPWWCFSCIVVTCCAIFFHMTELCILYLLVKCEVFKKRFYSYLAIILGHHLFPSLRSQSLSFIQSFLIKMRGIKIFCNGPSFSCAQEMHC